MLSEQDQMHRLYSTFLLAPSDIQFTVEVIRKWTLCLTSRFQNYTWVRFEGENGGNKVSISLWLLLYTEIFIVYKVYYHHHPTICQKKSEPWHEADYIYKVQKPTYIPHRLAVWSWSDLHHCSIPEYSVDKIFWE